MSLRDIECVFNVKKVTVGRLNSGCVFLYRRRLWIILNPNPAGGRFARTLIGEMHKSKVFKSSVKVWYLAGVDYRGMLK